MDPMAAYNQQREQQAQELRTVGIAAGMWGAWKLNSMAQAQQESLSQQAQILRQQQITNLLLAGYSEQQIMAAFDAQDRAAAREDAKARAGMWAVGQIVVVLIAAYCIWGSYQGYEVYNSDTMTGSTSHALGVGGWLFVVPAILILIRFAVRLFRTYSAPAARRDIQAL